ncbi:hypothetical protein ACIQWR_17135 [Streptomyces sp. NPDC098789]|uniref:helix-turn-helix domain-containing protein n=1 Tax=Streptomyces sp. NPDC098789 TaxID=3366098 RepID=UPI0037F28B85
MTTPEELAAAAKALMKSLGLSGIKIATNTGLSTGTISELINGKSFPRDETWELFVTGGCGQPWEMWRQARARAQRDLLRRRPPEELADRLEEAQERIQALESAAIEAAKRLALLEEQVAAIQSARSSERRAEDEEAAQRRQENAADVARQRQFGRALLTEVPVDFEHTMADGAWLAADVDGFVARVRDLALTSMDELRIFLATTPMSFPYAAMGDIGYYKEGVREYMVRLRLFASMYSKVSPEELDEMLASGVGGS